MKSESAMKNSIPETRNEANAVAKLFVSARRSGLSLTFYPGVFPQSPAEAYDIQDKALALWPEAPSGWKVALCAPAFRESFGEDRLSGPVFPKATLVATAGQPTEFAIFPKGFAAVEAEFIAIMNADAPHFAAAPTANEVAELIDAMHIGIETAGSQLSQINELGPLAVVSDFGNNAGVILGTEIKNWKSRALESMTSRMFVDGVEVGAGNAGKVPGGPLAAVGFLLYHLQQRGRQLKRGQLISTGATTGIHIVKVGSRITADFGSDGSIEAVAVSTF
jgi:2-keto-4-pentenoate hydratase